MYSRMTRLHFEDERYDDLLEWCETVRSSIEAVEGFVTADLIRTGPGEGMIIAFYQDEASFEAASDVTAPVLMGMAEFLNAPTHVHAGSVGVSFGR